MVVYDHKEDSSRSRPNRKFGIISKEHLSDDFLRETLVSYPLLARVVDNKLRDVLAHNVGTTFVS